MVEEDHTPVIRRSRRAFTLVELPAVSRRNRRAFTLVELLVVIAIILLLLVMLLPALKGAADYARTRTCLNNLHQIAAACFAYAGDHHGLLPYGVQYNSWGWRWETMLIPYLGLGVFTNGEGTLSEEAGCMIIGYTWNVRPRVIANPGVLACPEDKPSRNWEPNYFLLKSYSHNNGWSYDGSFPYGLQVPLSSIQAPTLTLMFMDNYDGFAGMNWGQFMITGPKEWSRGYDIRGSAAEVDRIYRDYGVVIPPGFNRNSLWHDTVSGENTCLRVPAYYPYHRNGWNISVCDGSARNVKLEDSFYPINLWSRNVIDKKYTVAY